MADNSGLIYYNNAAQVIKESIERLKTINQDKYFAVRDEAIDYYLYNNTKKYIDNYFTGSLQEEIPLYTSNLTKRLINRMSLVYKKPPIREIANNDYESLTIKKDWKFKTFERVHNLLGTIAVQVSWNGVGFNYTPIINFEPIFNPENPTEPMAVIYAVQKTAESKFHTQEDVFVYWDAEQHFKFDSTGKRISVNDGDVNPYGIIPFVFIQPNEMIDEFWNDGALDIPEANKQIDIAMTSLQHHIRAAGGQWVIEGRADVNKIKLGLNKVLITDGIVKNLGSQVEINGIMEGIKFQLQNVAQNHHITFDFGLSGSKSGSALIMENMELLESREDDVEKWNMVEQEVYQIEKVIAAVEMGRMLPEDIAVDFTEVNFPNIDKEIDEWEWKFKHGIADKIDYIMHKDPDKFDNREEAQAWLDERATKTDKPENVFKLARNGAINQ